MTPKEKAFDLWLKFRNELDFALDFDICRIYSRRVALIAVDEILGDIEDSILHPQNKEAIEYWDKVKQEIQKL